MRPNGVGAATKSALHDSHVLATPRVFRGAAQRVRPLQTQSKWPLTLNYLCAPSACCQLAPSLDTRQSHVHMQSHAPRPQSLHRPARRCGRPGSRPATAASCACVGASLLCTLRKIFLRRTVSFRVLRGRTHQQLDHHRGRLRGAGRRRRDRRGSELVAAIAGLSSAPRPRRQTPAEIDSPAPAPTRIAFTMWQMRLICRVSVLVLDFHLRR